MATVGRISSFWKKWEVAFVGRTKFDKSVKSDQIKFSTCKLLYVS